MTHRLPDEAKDFPTHHFRPPHPSDTADEPTAARSTRPTGPRAPRPWYALIWGQWPLAVTLLGVGAGVGWVALGHWKRGSFLIGATFLVALALRTLLPERWIGLLGVRGRAVDAACLAVLGGGILLLSLIVPPAP